MLYIIANKHLDLMMCNYNETGVFDGAQLGML